MNLLERLLARGCAHHFSWPRVGKDGRHYQICLTCGTAYEYDWRKMRRTDRMLPLQIHPTQQSGATA